MTGFASQLADGLVLGNSTLFLNAVGAVLAFLTGAAVCAILVNWGRHHHRHSVYALPLFLEAVLLLTFGLMGTVTLSYCFAAVVPDGPAERHRLQNFGWQHSRLCRNSVG